MKERTSWDGAMQINLILLMGKIANGLAIAWGIWTIWKSE